MSIYTIVICTRGDKAQRLSGTKEGGGALFMRGAEFGAAGLVLLFGAGLLFGYLAAERVTCFQSLSARERNCAHRWRSGHLAASRRMGHDPHGSRRAKTRSSP
jgi:hypothetical protein